MEVTQSDLGLGARLHTRLGFSGAGGFSVQSPEFGAVKCGDKWVKVMPYMRWYSRDTPARAPLMKSFKYNPHERAPFGWARIPTHSSTYRRLPFQDVGEWDWDLYLPQERAKVLCRRSGCWVTPVTVEVGNQKHFPLKISRYRRCITLSRGSCRDI